MTYPVDKFTGIRDRFYQGKPLDQQDIGYLIDEVIRLDGLANDLEIQLTCICRGGTNLLASVEPGDCPRHGDHATIEACSQTPPPQSPVPPTKITTTSSTAPTQ